MHCVYNHKENATLKIALDFHTKAGLRPRAFCLPSSLLGEQNMSRAQKLLKTHHGKLVLGEKGVTP